MTSEYDAINYYRSTITHIGKLKFRGKEYCQLESDSVTLVNGMSVQIDCQWYCYMIQSYNKQRTYIGYTNNIYRRLRQHNGEIKGGAKATRGHGPWTLIVYVQGFLSANEAMSFEWYMHHPLSIYRSKLNVGSRRFTKGSGLKYRLRNMETMLHHRIWLMKYKDPIFRKRILNIFWHINDRMDVEQPQWYFENPSD
jgi:predicted GIY-YIG superfamily endonuclease